MRTFCAIEMASAFCDSAGQSLDLWTPGPLILGPVTPPGPPVLGSVDPLLNGLTPARLNSLSTHCTGELNGDWVTHAAPHCTGTSNVAA